MTTEEHIASEIRKLTNEEIIDKAIENRRMCGQKEISRAEFLKEMEKHEP